MQEHKRSTGLTRRAALKRIAQGMAATAVMPRLLSPAMDRARIVRVESDKVWNGEQRDPEVVAAMIDRGLVALTGKTTAAEAWKSLFSPFQRVGVKINLLGRPRVYTACEVAAAVTAGLVLAGIKGENIVVWDRPESHFGLTAYKLGRGKLGERIEGGGCYSFCYKDRRSYVETSGCGDLPVDLIPLTRTEATVNLPVLKDHGISGVTGALKNIAFGCYHTTPQAHDGHCDPFIAEACQGFTAVNPVPLIVLDATQGCFDGGPVPGNSRSIWKENAVYLSTDPVALDRVCCLKIAAKRKAAGLPDVTPMARHIETAAAKGLGVADAGRIDIVTLRV
jgi:uncharacterized protein (DUF362 family)